MISHTFSVTGFILKRRNLSESDRLITVYTRNKGKIVVIAKGIRKIHSRKSPHMEIFNLVNLFLARGRTFPVVTEVSTQMIFKNIASNLTRIAYGYKMIETVDRLCPQSDVNEQVFNLLHHGLMMLNNENNESSSKICDIFISQLLWRLGYSEQNTIYYGEKLDSIVHSILEKTLKSSKLITKI